MEKTFIIKRKGFGEKELRVIRNESGDVRIQQLDPFGGFITDAITLSGAQLEELFAEIKK
jgi:hypothetical protein